MTKKPHPSKEDVLDAFAVEPDLGRPTVERYLRAYPNFAEEIVDLAAQLRQADVEERTTLLPEEQVMINSSWKRYSNSDVKIALNPFASLSAPELKKIADALRIKRSVLTAFRECTVIAASVPSRFMQSLADVIGTTVEVLRKHLECRPKLSLSRSYKSDKKPQISQAVSFEQLLIDAGLPESERKRLLREE